MSTQLEPLYQLLAKDIKCKWGRPQAKAFQQSKNMLVPSQLLVHFNPELPLKLACDAFVYGIGAHRMPDESEKCIG